MQQAQLQQANQYLQQTQHCEIKAHIEKIGMQIEMQNIRAHTNHPIQLTQVPWFPHQTPNYPSMRTMHPPAQWPSQVLRNQFTQGPRQYPRNQQGRKDIKTHDFYQPQRSTGPNAQVINEGRSQTDVFTQAQSNPSQVISEDRSQTDVFTQAQSNPGPNAQGFSEKKNQTAVNQSKPPTTEKIQHSHAKDNGTHKAELPPQSNRCGDEKQADSPFLELTGLDQERT
jgi:hypothetical protein